MSPSREEYEELVVSLGILSRDQMDDFLDSLDVIPQSGQELLHALHHCEKLTAFQLEEILEGRGKSLKIDRYLILKRIGAGGMGEVFLAYHQKMNREVALKMLPDLVKDDPEKLSRFHREVQAAAALSHDNIVHAYDAADEDGRHCLAMEYVRAENLASWVNTNGPMNIKRALDIIRQAAEGLQHAHAQGLIHRDIKPSNLLLTEEGKVKILDFGLASINQENMGSEQELTQSGTMMGTVAYMSPEQSYSSHDVDSRTDIYSLGATLFYLLTARIMYPEGDLVQKVTALRNETPPSLARLRNDVGADIERLYQKMVAKKLEERYQSIDELRRDIQACLGLSPERVVTADPALRKFLEDQEERVTPTVINAAKNEQEPETIDSEVAIKTPQSDSVHTTILQSTVRADVSPRRRKRNRTGPGVVGVLAVLLVVGGILIALNRDIEPPPPAPVSPVSVARTNPEDVSDPGPERLSYEWPEDQPDPTIAPFDSDAARKHQREWAAHLGMDGFTTNNSVDIRMVVIPPGEFLMGMTYEQVKQLRDEIERRPKTESYGFVLNGLSNEAPQHHVVISKPFLMSATEITRGQFRQFVEDENYITEPERDGKGGMAKESGGIWNQNPKYLWDTSDIGFIQTEQSPVINITWNDAVAFCEWLSLKEGKTYRLPTEAEWEYACRAGTTGHWSLEFDSIDLLESHAWFKRNKIHQDLTYEVGLKIPNAFGLYDMHGNVREWCRGCFSPYFSNAQINPRGPENGIARVVRGGCTPYSAYAARSSRRAGLKPHERSLNLGFRVVCEIEPSK